MPPTSSPVTSSSRQTASARAGLDLSIVIVSWNTRELLRKCLQTVAVEQRAGCAEVFVVDNHSGDGSAAMVASDFPWVKLIANRDNRGFAKANNQAIWLSRGKKVLLLNPDTELKPGCLEQLMRFLDDHPQAGVVAPQLLNTDGSIQRSCRELPTLRGMLYELFGLSRLYRKFPEFGRYKMLGFDYSYECRVDQPEGACLLIRREVLDEVGLLDEGYFMLFEEVDWCHRVKQAGWEIWYTPSAQVVHHYGQSIKQVKAKMIVSSHSGLYRYWHKHHSHGRELFAPLVYASLMALAVVRIISHLIRQKCSAAKARLASLQQQAETARLRALLASSKVFDVKWYLQRYPDVKASQADPIVHYLTCGAAEGRDPGPAFHTKWYLQENPDVAAQGINPVVHYLQFGRQEGRLPAPPALSPADRYAEWVEKYDVLSESDRDSIRRVMAGLKSRPKISVLMPVYNVDLQWLGRAIDSVASQLYPNWELCISDDASTDPAIGEFLRRCAQNDDRIKLFFRQTNGHISENSNSALALATGDYIALLDCDDELAESALFWVAYEVNKNAEIDMIFSDEDQIDEANRRDSPYFKSDWNPSLMTSQNAFGHLSVVRRSLVQQVGGFRKGFEGSQDHDLALRCSELSLADRIKHIPRVLYHWRTLASSTAVGPAAKPYAWTAGAAAIREHFERQGIAANVKAACGSWYQVEYALPDPAPGVSIIIPTAFCQGLVRDCLASVLTKSTYRNFEVLVLVNERHASLPENQLYLEQVRSDTRVKVLAYPDQPFNYSIVNNFGVSQATSPFICFLNDDTRVIDGDWLEQLVARAVQPGVGAVGPLLLYPDDTVQHAGVILGLAGTAGHVFSRLPKGSPGYMGRAALEQDLSCITAACMIVRAESFQQLGGFDPQFAVAFNDVDLCIRLKKAGWRLIWTPAASLYHCESVSVGQPDASDRAERFAQECLMLRTAHGDIIDNDPNYNPNLSLTSARCELSFPPRVDKLPALSDSPDLQRNV